MAAVKAAGASEAIECWNGFVAPTSEPAHAKGLRAVFTVTCSWTQTAKTEGCLVPSFSSPPCVRVKQEPLEGGEVSSRSWFPEGVLAHRGRGSMPARVCGRPHTVASQQAENTDQNQRQINLQDLPLPTPFFQFSPGLPRLRSLPSIPSWGQVFKHRSL